MPANTAQQGPTTRRDSGNGRGKKRPRRKNTSQRPSSTSRTSSPAGHRQSRVHPAPPQTAPQTIRASRPPNDFNGLKKKAPDERMGLARGREERLENFNQEFLNQEMKGQGSGSGFPPRMPPTGDYHARNPSASHARNPSAASVGSMRPGTADSYGAEFPIEGISGTSSAYRSQLPIPTPPPVRPETAETGTWPGDTLFPGLEAATAGYTLAPGRPTSATVTRAQAPNIAMLNPQNTRLDVYKHGKTDRHAYSNLSGGVYLNEASDATKREAERADRQAEAIQFQRDRRAAQAERKREALGE